jgi:uncharacterized membrane protein
MIATLVDGYGDTAEWLMVLAAIAFFVAAVIAWSARPHVEGATGWRTTDPTRGALVPFGLTLVAIALLVI